MAAEQRRTEELIREMRALADVVAIIEAKRRRIEQARGKPDPPVEG